MKSKFADEYCEQCRKSPEKAYLVINALLHSASPVFFAALTLKGKILSLSDSALKALGRRRGDVAGRNFLSLIQKGDRRRVSKTLGLLAHAKKQSSEQFFMQGRGGSRIFTEWHFSQIPGKGTKPAYLFCVGIDRTARSEREEELLKLSAAVQQTADSIIIADREGRIEYVNPSFERLTGYRRGEVIDRTPRVLKSGVQNLAFYKKLWRTVLSGNVFHAVFANKRKNGQVYYQVETITPIKDGRGRITHFLSTARDITEQRRSEEALRESEERYRSLFHSSIDSVIAVDNSGRVMSVNPALSRLTGHPREYFEGKRLSRLGMFPKKGKMLIAKSLVEKVAWGSKPFWLEIRTRGRERIPVEAQIASIKLDGATSGVTLVMEDARERKMAEALLRHHAEELESEVASRTAQLEREMEKVEKLSEVKDEFIRNVSHELKTPLSVILLDLPLAKRMAAEGREAEFEELMELINRNANRLRNSIEDVLELSRLGTVSEYKRERVEVRQLVGYAVELSGPVAREKGLAMDVDVPELAVLGDPSLLPYVLSNIVSNSVKFTERGGVGIRAREERGSVLISVSDTGVGIAEKDKDKVFSKFFKAEPSAPGTGVGLAIVREIVEGHGGTIGFKSKLGKGTTFTISLPKAKR